MNGASLVPALAAEGVEQAMTIEQWFQLFFVFVMAVAAGVALISKVPPLLHTPLMSGSNAISGITLVGAIAAAGYATTTAATVLAFFAVTLATLNVVGGYAVTDRMLQMFKKQKK